MDTQATWSSYVFTVYHHNASWNDVAGIYIFCGINQQNQWLPLYIGQADSFRTRIPGHEKWTQAQRLGATHVHALAVPLAANRDLIEEELIQTYQPHLNIQLR